MIAYVEDPGGANAIAALLPRLGADAEVRVLASGAGARQLAVLNLPAETVDPAADADRMIKAHRPHCLVVGTSENSTSLGLRLVQAARRTGTPTVGIVDGTANADWRFRGTGDDPLSSAPDWIVVPDRATAEAYQTLGHPGERIVTVGDPHLARIAAERPRLVAIGQRALRERLFPHLDPDRKWILFLSERSEGLDQARFRKSATYTLPAPPGEERRTHIVLAAFLAALDALRPKPIAMLRLHPKDEPAEYQAYAGAFDATSGTEAPHELVFAADLVVGMTTMLLAEAVALGRPVLSIVPRVCEAGWLPTSVRQIIPVVAEMTEIAPAMRTGLARGVVEPPDFAPPSAALDDLRRQVL